MAKKVTSNKSKSAPKAKVVSRKKEVARETAGTTVKKSPYKTLDTVATRKRDAKSGATKKQAYFVFKKQNYMLMAGGFAIMVLGYILMIGGGVDPATPDVFPKEEIYSFRRITLAPIVIIIGLIVEVFAIFWQPKNQSQQA